MSATTTSALKWWPPNAAVVTLPAPAVADTYGDWTEIVASAAADSQVAGFMAGLKQSSGGGSPLVEIQLGTGSGTPVPFGEFLVVNDGAGNLALESLMLPVPVDKVKAGDKVSGRIKQSGTVSAVDVAVGYYENLDGAGSTTGYYTYAPHSTSTSVGLLTPSATPWDDSVAWLDLIAALAEESSLIGIGLIADPSEDGAEYEVDLASGASTLEQLATTLRSIVGDDDHGFTNAWLPAMYPVVAGTRVSCKLRKAGTSTSAMVARLLYIEGVDLLPPVEVAFVNDRVPGLTHIEIPFSGAIECFSVIPMDDPPAYDHGPKRPRVLSWADIRRTTSDFYGVLVAADFRFTVRDKDLRVLGYLGDTTKVLQNQYTVTRSISDPDRRLQKTRRVIFRGPIRSITPRAGAIHEFVIKDWLQERFGPNSDIAALPRRKVLADDFPGAGATKVNSSAEQYVVHGAHPAIVAGAPAATAYVSDGSTSAGATSMAVRTGNDTLLGTVTFANQPEVKYTVLTRTGSPTSTAFTFFPALQATVPDGTAITIDYGGQRIAVHNGVGTFSNDQIKFSNHDTVYNVSGSLIGDPEIQIVISGALTADVPDGTTITQTPTHQVTAATGMIVPVRFGLITDQKVTSFIDFTDDSGDGQGKSIYVGDELQDDGFTYAMFLWACHGCYSPSGRPIQQLYFFNEAVDNLDFATLYYNDVPTVLSLADLETEAGTGGRILLPGYDNWTDNGYTTSHVDIHGRRYLKYGLRGIYRDWALGVRQAPQNFGGIPHSVNGYGADMNFDGTGAEVRDIHDQVRMAFNNFAWGDYQSGAPLPDPTFPDDGTLTLLNLESWDRAKAHAQTLVPGGFLGFLTLGVDNNPITMAEFWKRSLLAMGVQGSWSRKTQWMIDRQIFDQDTAMTGAPTLTDERDIRAMSLETDEGATQLFTAIPFSHTFDEWGRATGGWRSTTADVNVASSATEYADAPDIITRYNPSGAKLFSQPVQFHFLRGKNRSADVDAYQQGSDTINAILAYMLAMAKVRILTLTTWGKGYDIEMFDRLWIQHFAIVGSILGTGDFRRPRPVRVIEHDAQPDRWRVTLRCFDLGRLFEVAPLPPDDAEFHGVGGVTIGAPSISGLSGANIGTGSVTIGGPGVTGAGSLGGTIVLAWNANPPEEAIDNYKVKWGTTTGVYTSSVNVGLVTTYTLTGLTPATTYFIVIEASSGGVFSSDSGEVSGVAS